MLKNKKIVTYIQTFRGLFSDRLSMLVIFSAFLMQVLVFFLFFHKQALTIFPNKDILAGFYNDSVDGGNSIIEKHTVSDSTLTMEFILKEGFVRPYVGINLQGKPDQYFDVSAYDQVLIEGKSNEISSIVIHLITRNKAQFKGYSRFNDLYFSSTIELAPEKKTFKININRFKTPDWWFDINNLSPTHHFSPDWKHFIHMDLATGLTPAVGARRSLIIYKVEFIRNNSRTLIAMIFIQLIIMLSMFGLYYSKSAPHRRERKIIISYKPIVVDNQIVHADYYLEYINHNFYDSELSLKKISNATGISHRNITDGISKQFNCNFKTYINRIRVNEAKRLLRETNLHISEIAYNVGFNSPSNFNRVFKNLTGKSPSEFLLGKE